MTNVLRIAMWSGPRNISTAMMRAWENRADTVVVDEPLYAHYLAETGLDHPMRDEVIAHGDTDWQSVAAALTGPVPDNASVFYQKHMAQHLLPNIGRDWLAPLTHVFLIREPREVLLSYIKARPTVVAEDLGFPQQLELFDQLTAEESPPPIIDAGDFLRAPGPMLEALCERLGIAFDSAMLSWPAGPRDSDGIWAAHWYAAVEQSTGFAPYRPRTGELPNQYQPVLADCQPAYDRLHALRLTV